MQYEFDTLIRTGFEHRNDKMRDRFVDGDKFQLRTFSPCIRSLSKKQGHRRDPWVHWLKSTAKHTESTTVYTRFWKFVNTRVLQITAKRRTRFYFAWYDSVSHETDVCANAFAAWNSEAVLRLGFHLPFTFFFVTNPLSNTFGKSMSSIIRKAVTVTYKQLMIL